MKVIINQDEFGLLFKNGVYSRMLAPGKHAVSKIGGETYVVISSNSQKSIENVSGVAFETLLKDENFSSRVMVVDVPDGSIAVVYQAGRVLDVHTSGKKLYFNLNKELSFQTFDMTTIDIDVKKLPPHQIACLPDPFYKKVVINEGEVGILELDGKFNRLLEAGVYYFWDYLNVTISIKRVDLRSQELQINGQEILTADKVTLRVNFVVNYRITDAEKIVREIKDYKERIYTLTQLSVREYIGKFKFDEILEQKESIATHVLELLNEKSVELYVTFENAGLKDIILPGDIREIMNTVLIAEKKAQANVIARREEVASTRSLLNTAKLLDENATLYKLKELEYLEKIFDKVSSVSVSGGSFLSELQKMISSTPRP